MNYLNYKHDFGMKKNFFNEYQENDFILEHMWKNEKVMREKLRLNIEKLKNYLLH